MPAVINSGTGGELNPGFDGGGPVATAVAMRRTTHIEYSGGSNVLSCQTTYGWDQVTGEARIVCATPTGSVGDSVTLSFGATDVVQRFSGTVVQIDTTLAPHAVMMLCKGPLYGLETFRNDTETDDVDLTRPGLSFEDLVGAATATLKQIITAVLDLAGVGYSGGNIEDPGHVYGLLQTEDFTWGTHETAAAYVHRVLEASAGYRLFDSADGNVYLKQITATPGGGSDIPDFTAGIDIFGDTQHSGSSIGRQAAVIVHGYDDGSGPATSGIVGSGQSAFQVNSSLIETDAFATEIANFWLPQVSRLQEIVRLSTPRDDLIGPAQTHRIGGVAADAMWVKSVTAEISAGGEFTQHVVYVSSGN